MKREGVLTLVLYHWPDLCAPVRVQPYQSIDSMVVLAGIEGVVEVVVARVELVAGDLQSAAGVVLVGPAPSPIGLSFALLVLASKFPSRW